VPATALLFIALGLLQGPRFLILGLAPAFVLVVGLLVLVRRSPRQLARRLRRIPAASEPFTFIAAADGTHSRNPTGSSEVAWVRYKSVTTEGNLLTLMLDTDAVQVVPMAALQLPHFPTDFVVVTIARWISEATSASDMDSATTPRDN